MLGLPDFLSGKVAELRRLPSVKGQRFTMWNALLSADTLMYYSLYALLIGLERRASSYASKKGTFG
jgi:hypothetical protein